MPKFQIRVVCDATAYATVTVEGDDIDDAIERARTDEVISQANWQMSDGNYVDPHDVSIERDEIQQL